MPRLASTTEQTLTGLRITRTSPPNTIIGNYGFEGTGVSPDISGLENISLSGTVTTSTDYALTGTQSAKGSTAFKCVLPQPVGNYINAGGFTIEGWIYPVSNPGSYVSYLTIFGNASADYISLVSYNNTGLMVVQGSSGGGGGIGSALLLNQWNHIFMSWRADGKLFYGRRGEYWYSPSDTVNPSIRDPRDPFYTNINQVTIGNSQKSYSGPWTNSYMDQFRISSKFRYGPLIGTGGNGTYTVPTF